MKFNKSGFTTIKIDIALLRNGGGVFEIKPKMPELRMKTVIK